MADKKITDLTADTSPTSDDLIVTVTDPGGTPASRKVTLANLWKAIQTWVFAEDAGSTDTYTATLSPAPAAYVNGQHYRFKANTANTGACTINFNGLGAKTIKKAAGGITTDLSDNDIRAGQWVDLVYDSNGNMQMQSQLGNATASHSHTSSDITDFAEAVEDEIGSKVVAGTGISVSYNDGTGETTVTNTSPDTGSPLATEDVQDIVGAMLTDSSTIDFSYNDGAGTETASVIDDSITNTKLANMANATVKGRNTAGTGDPEDVTMAQLWALIKTQVLVEFCIAASDETTALSAGTSKVTFRMPHAMTVTAVRASLSTAQTSGSIFTVDINEGGTTILSTKLTIDNAEKTSTTAATGAVISDSSLADDAEITIDIDQIGDGTAKGLKVYVIGTRA